MDYSVYIHFSNDPLIQRKWREQGPDVVNKEMTLARNISQQSTGKGRWHTYPLHKGCPPNHRQPYLQSKFACVCSPLCAGLETRARQGVVLPCLFTGLCKLLSNISSLLHGFIFSEDRLLTRILVFVTASRKIMIVFRHAKLKHLIFRISS